MKTLSRPLAARARVARLIYGTDSPTLEQQAARELSQAARAKARRIVRGVTQ